MVVSAGRPAKAPDAPVNVPVVLSSTFHAGGPVAYGLQTGVIPGAGTYGLATDEYLLPQMLKDAGYKTAMKSYIVPDNVVSTCATPIGVR